MKKLLAIYIGWWSFWALLQTLILHRLGFTWEISSIDGIISNTLLALAGFVTITIYKYYQPGRSNRFYRFIFGVGITIFLCVSLRWVLHAVLEHHTEYISFLEKSMPGRFVFSFLIIAFISLMNWAWYYQQEQKVQEQRRNDAEQLAKEAELSRLRQQLQPHFLFNSLNSISALVGTRPNEARKMIQQLSDFLRGTLKKDDQLVVKLNEELQHLRLYLDIEKVRFGHRLNIDIHTDEAALDCSLPPLLLQPIVENAIKFGLYDTTEDVLISISAYQDGAFLCMDVTNPYDPETQSSSKGTGFGLSSVQRRLFLLYARQDLLSIEKSDRLFITHLKIPQTL